MKPKVKPRKKKQTQSTNWVFTLNNYTDEEVDFLGTLYMDPHPFPLNESKVVAVAMSEEIAPTTGTPHLQGYLQLTKKVTLSIMNDLPGCSRCRFAAMKGTFKENETYCSKSSTLIHYGEPFVGKGGRTDRNEYFALLKSGMTDFELMEADFAGYARFQRATAAYRSHVAPVRKAPLEIYLFFGEPGTGKTDFAYEQLGPDLYRLPVSADLWFTPSLANKTKILLDEFRANTKLWILLQLFDKRPIEVANKGGFLWYCPEVIVITTNRSPWDWYNYVARDKEREALFRRFTGCYRFEKNDEKIPCPREVDINNRRAFLYEDDPDYGPDMYIGMGNLGGVFPHPVEEIEEGMII